MEGSTQSETKKSTLSRARVSLLEAGYLEYSYKYVILLVFFGSSMTNQIMWVTCSPITTNIKSIFGVSELIVNFSAMLAMIVFIPAMIPGNYVLDKFGAKIGLIIGTALTLLGAWVRVLVRNSFYWVLGGQLLGALGQPFIINCPQKISAFWIYPRNRTIFTTLLTLAAPLGVAVGFVLPGVIVGDKDGPEGLDAVSSLMWIEAYISTALCIPLFIFFREKPPTPPSASAELERDDFKVGLKKIFKDRNFLLLLIVVGFGLGVYNCLATVVQPLISPFNFSQMQASALGAVIIIFGLIGAIAFGLFVEKTRKYKTALVICAIVTLVALALFAVCLFTENFIIICSITALLGFSLTPILPVGLELACETTFPVGEAVSGGALIGFSQIIGVIQIFSVDVLLKGQNKSRAVILSCVILIVFISAVFLAASFLQEDLKRTKHDRKGSQISSFKASARSSKIAAPTVEA